MSKEFEIPFHLRIVAFPSRMADVIVDYLKNKYLLNYVAHQTSSFNQQLTNQSYINHSKRVPLGRPFAAVPRWPVILFKKCPVVHLQRLSVRSTVHM